MPPRSAEDRPKADVSVHCAGAGGRPLGAGQVSNTHRQVWALGNPAVGRERTCLPMPSVPPVGLAQAHYLLDRHKESARVCAAATQPVAPVQQLSAVARLPNSLRGARAHDNTTGARSDCRWPN